MKAVSAAMSLATLMLVSGYASATAFFDATDVADTIEAFGPLIDAVVTLLPSIMELAIYVAILLFVLGVIGGILGFITGILSFSRIMNMIKK